MQAFGLFPFVRYVLCLIAGILCYQYTAHLSVIFMVTCWAISFCCYWTAYFFAPNRLFLGLLGQAMLTLLGWLMCYFQDSTHQANHYSHYLPQAEVFQVTIDSWVEEKPQTWKATGEVKQVIIGRKTVATQGSILLYFDKKTVALPRFQTSYWLKGHPQRIAAALNPAEFNYQTYLQRQGIAFQCYAKSRQLYLIPSSTTGFSVRAWAFRANALCDKIFTTYLSQKSSRAVANAMILGLRDELDTSLMQAYSASGAIHVLSVSGMHVGIIYQVLSIIFAFLLRKGIGGKISFFCLVFSCLWFYALLTGLSSPVLRSALMFSMFLVAQLLNRKQNPYNTLACSAFFLLLWKPLWLYDVGFQLSYLAVFGMVFFQPLLSKLWIIETKKSWIHQAFNALWQITTVSIAAQLCTFPLTIAYFHQFPLYFLLVNPFVIGFSTIVLCYGVFFLLATLLMHSLGISFGIKALATVLHYSIVVLNSTVEFTQQMPYSTLKNLSFSPLEIALWGFLLLGLGFLWHSRQYVWIKINLGLVLGLWVVHVGQVWQQSTQYRAVLHYTKQGYLCSIITGNQAWIMADSTLSHEPSKTLTHLNNYLATNGIQKIFWYKNTPEPIGYMPFVAIHQQYFSCWQIDKKTLLYLHQAMPQQQLRLTSLQPLDYLVLSHKSIRNLDEIAHIAYKQLILDGTVRPWEAERWQQQAQQQGIAVRWLGQTGAILL